MCCCCWQPLWKEVVTWNETCMSATMSTHICTHRLGPSSRWVRSRIHSTWGCCTGSTWRCVRYAPPPAESSRAMVHIQFTCMFTLTFTRFTASGVLIFFLQRANGGEESWLFVTMRMKTDSQCRCPFSSVSCAQVLEPAVVKKTKTEQQISFSIYQLWHCVRKNLKSAEQNRRRYASLPC